MKLVSKIVIGALSLFEKITVNRVSLEWFKLTIVLLINRLKLITEALTDDNLNNKEQLEEVAKQTILTKEFQDLQLILFNKLIEKSNDELIIKLITGTEELRSELFVAISDDVKPDSEQLKQALENFVHTETFDELAISFVKLLTTKYSKNELVNEFIVAGVESLVNADDTNQ